MENSCASLLTLPSDVLHRVMLHLIADSRALQALSQTHPKLARALTPFRQNLSFPLFVGAFSWTAYPTELLDVHSSHGRGGPKHFEVRRTSCPGHAHVILDIPLLQFNFHWAFELKRFRGRILEMGVAAWHKGGSVASENCVLFDCAGRVGFGGRKRSFGRIFQEGEIVGFVYHAQSRSLFVLDWKCAMGPPIVLKHIITHHHSVLRPYLKFGNIPYDCVAMHSGRIKSIGGLDASYQNWVWPSVLPKAHGCVVVVTWKEDTWYALRLDPKVATLDHLRLEVAVRSGLKAGSFELIMNRTRLNRGKATLAELGIHIDPSTGSHSHDILMSVPHLVS